MFNEGSALLTASGQFTRSIARTMKTISNTYAGQAEVPMTANGENRAPCLKAWGVFTALLWRFSIMKS